MRDAMSPRYVLPGAVQSIRIVVGMMSVAIAYWGINFAAVGSFANLLFAVAALAGALWGLKFRWSFAYLFWLSCTIYLFGGMVVYEAREAVYFNFDGDVSVPYNVWLLATVTTLFASLLGDFRPTRMNVNMFEQVRYGWVLFFAALGLASALAIFRTGVPILADDVSSARAASVEGAKGIFWSLYTALQLLCAMMMVRIFVGGTRAVRRWLDVALAVVLLIALSLYGGRFFVFFPVVLAVAYLYSLGLVKLRLLVGMLVALILISIAVSALRFSQYSYAGGDALWFIAVRNDLFPEARTLIQMTGLITHFDAEYFFSPFISFLPSFVYDLVGLNKADFLLSIGKYLNSFDSSGEDVGYRVTFLGEAYLAFGYAGVAAAALGVNLLSILFHRVLPSHWFSRMYVAFFGALLIPYGVTFVRSSIVMIPLGLIIIWLVIGRRRVEKRPGVARPFSVVTGASG